MKGAELRNKVLTNIGKVIIGKENIAEFLLTALLADGHVLLEDVPGTGKTQLAETTDVREKCQVVKSRKKRETEFTFLSYRKRIRKLYRKRMLAEKQILVGDKAAGALSYMTAKECCECPEKEPLAKIYEKVRYSSENITAGDNRSFSI